MYDMMFSLCSHICHQNPQRSFHCWGYQVIVCARCTGIYLLIFFSLTVVWLPGLFCKLNIIEQKSKKRKLSEVQSAVLLAALLVFACLINYAGKMIEFADSNASRFIQGAFLGFALGMLYGVSLKIIFTRSST